MRRRVLFLIGLFSIVFIGLFMGTLWVLQNISSEPEVTIIYEIAPFERKPVNISQVKVKQREIHPAFTIPDSGYPDKIPKSEVLSEDEVLTAEEEAAFAQWLATQEEAYSGAIEPISEESDEVLEPEEAPGVVKLTDGQIYNLVLDTHELVDILDEYGVHFDRSNGNGACPFCSSPNDFRVMVNGATGRYGYWGCVNCGDNGGVLGPNDLIMFVGKMEGIDKYHAARYLAERAGFLD